MDSRDVKAVQAAALVMSQAACAMARAAGMTAENQYRMACGNQVAYGEDAFLKLIDEYGIDHNAVVSTLKGGE